jgi:hypothetical protein
MTRLIGISTLCLLLLLTQGAGAFDPCMGMSDSENLATARSKQSQPAWVKGDDAASWQKQRGVDAARAADIHKRRLVCEAAATTARQHR